MPSDPTLMKSRRPQICLGTLPQSHFAMAHPFTTKSLRFTTMTTVGRKAVQLATAHWPLPTVVGQWLYRNSLELRRAHRASSRPSFRLLAFVTPSRTAAVSSGVGYRLSAARYRCSTISSFVRPACKSRPSTPRSLRILAFRVSPPTRSSNWVRLDDCLRVQVAFSRLGRSKIVRKYESTIG